MPEYQRSGAAVAADYGVERFTKADVIAGVLEEAKVVLDILKDHFRWSSKRMPSDIEASLVVPTLLPNVYKAHTVRTRLISDGRCAPKRTSVILRTFRTATAKLTASHPSSGRRLELGTTLLSCLPLATTFVWLGLVAVLLMTKSRDLPGRWW